MIKTIDGTVLDGVLEGTVEMGLVPHVAAIGADRHGVPRPWA